MVGAKEKVWVGIRLRPLLDAEVGQQDEYRWGTSGTSTLRLLQQEGQDRGGIQHVFARVFDTTATGQEVYTAAAKERVRSSLQGIHGSILCYGATGSGKTHTMQQLLSLAVADMYDTIGSNALQEYTLQVSALEIYNERVRDLSKEGTENQDLDLLEVRNKNAILVRDLCIQSVKTPAQLERFIATASARRTVRDTRANVASSRSHQVIQIYIESRPSQAVPAPTDSPTLPGQPTRSQEEGDTGIGSAASEAGSSEDARPVTSATLTFVDLAGSERVSTAALEDANQRARLLEGSTINRSLLTLGSVIRALGDASTSSTKGNQVYVGYRDSKLTRVLKPSLEGNARTAIICCISPAASAMDTTRSTLHFAERAQRVSMTPSVNVTMSPTAELRRLRNANASLQAQLDCKDLGKEMQQLRAEIARMEEELRIAGMEKDAALMKLDLLQNGDGDSSDDSFEEAQPGTRKARQTGATAQNGMLVDTGHADRRHSEADLQADLDRIWALHNDKQPSSLPTTRQEEQLIPAAHTPRTPRLSARGSGGAAAGWAALQSNLPLPHEGGPAEPSSWLHKGQSSPRSPKASSSPAKGALPSSRLSRIGQEAEALNRLAALPDSFPASHPDAGQMAERMQFEKKLLLQRVLKAENALQDSRRQCAQLQHQRSSSPGNANGKVPLLNLTMQADDDWAAPMSRQAMVRHVCLLWHQQNVPLKTRSRFWASFRGREDHFWESELRRLTHEAERLSTGPSQSTSPRSHAVTAAAERQLSRSGRALKWEKSWLEAQLGKTYPKQQRSTLCEQWGIPPGSSRRKRQLIDLLWSPDVLREADGMERSAWLVLQLHGCSQENSDDAAHDLIYSRSGGDQRGLKTLLPAHIPLPLQGTVSRMLTAAQPVASATPRAEARTPRPLLSSVWEKLTPRRTAQHTSGC